MRFFKQISCLMVTAVLAGCFSSSPPLTSAIPVIVPSPVQQSGDPEPHIAPVVMTEQGVEDSFADSSLPVTEGKTFDADVEPDIIEQLDAETLADNQLLQK